MEILGRARKSPRISENFGNASNPFLRSLNDLWNFWNFGNSSKVFSRCFYDFFKFSENLRKSSEIFGKLRKRFKSNFQTFLLFFKIFGKSAEIFEVFENLRKRFPDVIGNVRKGFGARFWEVLKWTKKTVSRKEWREGRVEYHPLHTAEYATVILASDWLYFSRHGIK